MILFITKYWRVIAVAFLCAALLGFTLHYQALKNENVRLKNELSTANETIGKLDEKVEKELQISNQLQRRLRRIRNAPADQDGVTAPILRDGIIGMKNDSQ